MAEPLETSVPVATSGAWPRSGAMQRAWASSRLFAVGCMAWNGMGKLTAPAQLSPAQSNNKGARSIYYYIYIYLVTATIVIYL